MKNTIISKFTSYQSTTPISVNLWNWLNDDTYKDIVYKIRTLTEKEEIKKLKSKLPCITPSGIFLVRNAHALIKHSGYICIDIDAGDNIHITDFENLRDELKKIKNIAYAGLSVSGKGVFCLIAIKHHEKHKEHFEALKICFKNLNITIDKACGDVSRLRGYSFDPNAYFNENSVMFNLVFEYQTKKVFQEHKPILENTYNNENITHSKVTKIVNKINNSGVDITENYEQWFQIGCALANEFGEEGRNMFHLVSQNHQKYHSESCDSFFTNCIEKKYSYNIGTFFHWAGEYGIV